MKRIRSRHRTDKMANEVRGSSKAWTRYIYLGLLTAFGLYLVNLAVGDLVFLRASGVVLQERVDLSVEYDATIQEVLVAPGAKVESGDTLLRISSLDARRTLVSLQERVVDLRLRLGEQSAEYATLPKLLEFADDNLRLANRRLSLVEDLRNKGLLSEAELSDAVGNRLDAQRYLLELESRRQVLKSEMDGLRPVLNDLVLVYDALRKDYLNGAVRAPVAGVAVPPLPVEGAAIVSGERVMSVYTGEPYIAAYIPDGTLYRLSVGDILSIRIGVDTYSGTVRTIQSVARDVPDVLLTTFGSPERRRLVKIDLDGEAPALFSTVEIRGDLLGWLPL